MGFGGAILEIYQSSCITTTPGYLHGLFFAGYVPLASQNPNPLYSILWLIIDPILVTFGRETSYF